MLLLIFWGLLWLAFVKSLNAKFKIVETFSCLQDSGELIMPWTGCYFKSRKRLACFGDIDILSYFNLKEWKYKVKGLLFPFIVGFQTQGLRVFFQKILKLESKEGRLSPDS